MYQRFKLCRYTGRLEIAMNTYYFYNPESFEFIGMQVQEFTEPPQYATLNEPPFEKGKRPVWTNNEWLLVEDYRKQVVYSPEGESLTITELGPIPDGYSFTRPNFDNSQRTTKFELDRIDLQSIRPLRAIINNDYTQADHDKLVSLEEQAKILREKVK
jgi:hypothetical protein